MKIAKEDFVFNISLTVLNDLGRTLYRNFITIIGEVISNSWDADASNVWIYIDGDNIIVKDDGEGMDADDFKKKFLTIGYSKRKEGGNLSKKRRPFIGRKGIGKLAVLSCSEKISIVSKTIEMDEYVGGVIDNSELDEAISDAMEPQEFHLENPEASIFSKYAKGHKKGTIIYFENIKEGVRNRLEYIRQQIALYFRFSLLDLNFHIYVNGKEVTLKDLEPLAEKTQFLWIIGNYSDPYIQKYLSNLKETDHFSVDDSNIQGFIASVEKPRDLKIRGSKDVEGEGEKVGIDLFVNGRMRERNILQHISTDRMAESYLYGQVCFNPLDDDKDRFTPSREGIVADDPKYKKFLSQLRKDVVLKIVDVWDKLRTRHRETGDPENPRLTDKERGAVDLYNAIAKKDYTLDKSDSPCKKKVDNWVGELMEEAKFSFPSYAECFVSENLIRKYIQEKKIPLSPDAEKEIKEFQTREKRSKGAGNISIDIRQEEKLSYLSMDGLANLVDKNNQNKEASLSRSAKEYKSFRDALMHTAFLTDGAKQRLTDVYKNIVGRVKELLCNVSQKEPKVLRRKKEQAFKD